MFLLRPRPLSLSLAFLPWPRRAVVVPATIDLRARDVVRGTASTWRPVTLTVTRGTVWLTTFPATGDIVIRAGETVRMTRPWLAEALDGDAVMVRG